MTATSEMTGFPILSLITFLPSIGGLFIIVFIRKEWTVGIKWAALYVSLATFALALYLLIGFK